MVKILSQAGNSLADVYDVEGSIAGIDQLETRELGIIHEMGATVFSERLSGLIQFATTGALNQNVAFDIVSTGLPAGPFRVWGVFVQANVAARLDRVQISLRTIGGREMPIFIWDTTNDIESDIRIIDEQNPAAVVNRIALVQANPAGMPSMGMGTGQPQRVGDEIVMRGLTTGFGAGTITIDGLVYTGFGEIRGISSRGLPIPGW